jgi:hypothetical protein
MHSLHVVEATRRKYQLLSVRPVTGADAVCFYTNSERELAPFNHPSFLEILATAYQRELVLLGVFEGEALEAVASLLIQRVGPLGIAQRLPIRYIGLVTEQPGSVSRQLDALKEYLGQPSYRVGTAYYGFPPGFSCDGLPDTNRHTVAGADETFVLSLCDLTTEGLPHSAGRRSLEKLRATRRAGLKIRDATEHDLRVLAPRLLETTYSRTGLESPYPEALHQQLLDLKDPDCRAHARVALVEDAAGAETVLGMLLCLTDRCRAHSLWYAKDYANPLARKLAVEESLIADMAVRARALGCKEYDLGGGPEGIKEFKRRLGAEPRSYVYVKVTHPRYRLPFEAHRRAKEVFASIRRRCRSLSGISLWVTNSWHAVVVSVTLLSGLPELPIA